MTGLEIVDGDEFGRRAVEEADAVQVGGNNLLGDGCLAGARRADETQSVDPRTGMIILATTREKGSLYLQKRVQVFQADVPRQILLSLRHPSIVDSDGGRNIRDSDDIRVGVGLGIMDAAYLLPNIASPASISEARVETPVFEEPYKGRARVRAYGEPVGSCHVVHYLIEFFEIVVMENQVCGESALQALVDPH